MERLLLIALMLTSSLSLIAQSIGQLGSWNNNANFVIQYHQNMVITSTTSGIMFIDVSDSTHPTPTASIGNPGSFPMAITVDGDYAYFGGGMTGYFMIADISNLAFPYQTGITTEVYGTGYQIGISGNYAFMATNLDTLYAIDISNKTAPAVIGKLYLGAFPGGIAVHGSYVYVGTTLGLKIVDISTPSSMAIVNTFGSGYGKIAADTANQRLFVAKSSGFDVIDISSPTSPSGLFMGIGGGAGGDICYHDTYVFENGSGNTNVFQVDLVSATFLDSFNTTFTGQVNGITVKDSIFYVSTVNDLHVLKYGYSIPTGIHSLTNETFRIWPNPSSGTVWLDLPRNLRGATLELRDLSGKLLRTVYASSGRIELDISDIAAGMYVLTHRSAAGTRQQLLVKE